MMNKEAQANSIETTRTNRWKQFFSLLLVMVMLLEFLPQTSWAAWDGSGSIGSGSAEDVSGADVWLPTASSSDMIGYRLSVDDADGMNAEHNILCFSVKYTCQMDGNMV